MFLLFSKFTINDCEIKFLFFKKKKLKTNLLKAPSRHKKFFHQIVNEVFLIKIFFYFYNYVYMNSDLLVNLFNHINNIFLNIGSNTLTRTRLSMSTKNKFRQLDLV